MKKKPPGDAIDCDMIGNVNIGKRNRVDNLCESQSKKSKFNPLENVSEIVQHTGLSETILGYFEALIDLGVNEQSLRPFIYGGKEIRCVELSEHLRAKLCNSVSELSNLLSEKVNRLDFQVQHAKDLLPLANQCKTSLVEFWIKFYGPLVARLWEIREEIAERGVLKVPSPDGKCYHFTIKTGEYKLRTRYHPVGSDCSCCVMEFGDSFNFYSCWISPESLTGSKDDNLRYKFTTQLVRYESFKREASRSDSPFALLFEPGYFSGYQFDLETILEISGDMLQLVNKIVEVGFDFLRGLPGINYVVEYLKQTVELREFKGKTDDCALVQSFVKKFEKIISSGSLISKYTTSQVGYLGRFGGFPSLELDVDATHKELPESDPASDGQDVYCQICTDAPRDAIVIYDCSHAVCVTCAINVKAQDFNCCPNCRHAISQPIMVPVGDLNKHALDSFSDVVSCDWGDKLSHLNKTLASQPVRSTLIICPMIDFSLEVSNFLYRSMDLERRKSSDKQDFDLYEYHDTYIGCTTVFQYSNCKNPRAFSQVIFTSDIEEHSKTEILKIMSKGYSGDIRCVILSDEDIISTICKMVRRRNEEIERERKDAEERLRAWNDLRRHDSSNQDEDPLDYDSTSESDEDNGPWVHNATPIPDFTVLDTMNLARESDRVSMRSDEVMPASPQLLDQYVEHASHYLSPRTPIDYSCLGSPSSPTYGHRLERLKSGSASLRPSGGSPVIGSNAQNSPRSHGFVLVERFSPSPSPEYSPLSPEYAQRSPSSPSPPESPAYNIESPVYSQIHSGITPYC